MAIHINQVLDYLDTHPICREADSVESLLEMIYQIYAEYNCFENEEIREKYRQIQSLLGPLTEETCDAVFFLICQLCAEHEQVAFSQGIIAGMNLMTEGNALP